MREHHELKYYIDLIRQNQPTFLTYSGTAFDDTGLESKLLKGFSDGTFSCDVSAAATLYQTSPSDIRYSVLKSRVKNKLVNSILLIDKGNNIDFSLQHHYERIIWQAKVLFQLKEYRLAEKQLVKAIKKATEHSFLSIIVAGLELQLELYYSQLAITNYEHTKEQLLYYQTKRSIEHKAQMLYQNTHIKYQNTEKKSGEMLEDLRLVVNQLEIYWQETNSFDCYYHYYKGKTWLLQASEDFQGLYLFTNHLLLEPNKNPGFWKRFNHQENQLTYLYTCFRTGRHEEGSQWINKNHTNFQINTRNWLSISEITLLLVIQAKDYHLAWSVYKEINRSPLIKSADKKLQEKWLLYRYYLLFIDPNEIYPELSKSRLPLLSKDKKGNNINILILEFCQKLLAKKHDSLLEKADFYKRYSDRYLQDEELNRSRLFFRFIQLIIRHNFNYADIEPKAKALAQQLKTPGKYSTSYYSSHEIIPYEDLQYQVMQLLQK